MPLHPGKMIDPWNEPRSLLPQILSHLNPSDDIAYIKEIELMLTTIQQNRETERQKWQDALNCTIFIFTINQ